MSAGIEIYNYVSNQKGSPALYSDIFANRPAAGFLGRLFISTDTLEIYRDTGTAWALISSGGGGVNIYNSDGTLTAARTMTMANHSLTFEGGANDARLIMSANNNVPRIFSFRTANVARWDFRVTDNETGSDSGGNWYLRAHNDAGAFTFAPISVERKTGEKSFYAQENLTAGTEAIAGVFNISAGTYGAGLTFIGGNAHAAQFNNFTLANGGSFTFASSSFVGASGNVLRVQANASGTVTMTPSTPGIRTAAVSLNQIQYNTSGSAALTYTHASIIQTLGILQLVASGSLTVTNAYGLIINDLNEYGNPSSGAGALILTNRWGIYQDSTTDVNYFGGTTLIGTTTNAGYKLDVAGTLRNTLGANFATTSGSVGIGTASPSAKLDVSAGNINLSNSYFLSSRNNANTLNVTMIGRNTSDRVIIDPDGYGTNIGGGGTVLLNPTGGNVGIGTTSPVSKFEVRDGDASVTTLSSFSFFNNNRNTVPSSAGVSMGGMRWRSYSTGTTYESGTQILSFTEAAWSSTSAPSYISFQTTASGSVTPNERMRITSDGKVLINTTTDAGQRLQINDSLRLVPTSSVPTASAGAMYYDSATNKLKLYDGTSWVDLN